MPRALKSHSVAFINHHQSDYHRLYTTNTAEFKGKMEKKMEVREKVEAHLRSVQEDAKQLVEICKEFNYVLFF